MSWRIAKSLDTLRKQINADFPTRDKSSDGTIGDQSHSARKSDHNPNKAGVVCAYDIDEDLNSTTTLQQVVDSICAARDPRVNYIIYEAKITIAGSELQRWKKYTGKNAHKHHAHISVHQDPKLYDSTAPWKIDVVKTSAAAPLQQTESLNKAGSEIPETTSEQPPSNGQTIKAEITSEGAVTVEKTEGAPAPKERIAVVKTQPQKWSSRVWTKITGAVTGNALFQWVWGQLEKIQALSVPDGVWMVVSITIAAGSLLWIIHEIVDTWRKNNYQQSIDDLLVKENSTPDNLVQLIPSDEVELYRMRGFKIITRGEKA